MKLYNDFRDFFLWSFTNQFGEKVTDFMNFLTRVNIRPAISKIAIDVSEGGGYELIALANFGYSVLAIHSKDEILAELKLAKRWLDIDVVKADLSTIRNYKISKPELIVCIGKVFLEAKSKNEFKAFIENVVLTLNAGGKLILAFPDFSQRLVGNARFLTLAENKGHCITNYFFERINDVMSITEIKHQQNDGLWHHNIHTRCAIIISTPEAIELLESFDLDVCHKEHLNGLSVIIAVKKSPPRLMPVYNKENENVEQN